MKMSFIQAGREGERERWDQNHSGILKQESPKAPIRPPQAVLSRLSWRHDKGSPGDV